MSKSPTAQQTLRRSAEQKAASLPALLVDAERVANTVAFGIHGRRRVGQGEAFWQFRHYSAGDSRSAIDWRKSARAASHENLYVRESEWEAAQSVYLAIESGPSMNYQSTENHRTKNDVATILGLALALLLVRAGERIANLNSDTPPTTGRAAYNRFAEELLKQDGKTTTFKPGRKLPANARVVYISDFLKPIDELMSELNGPINQGLQGFLLQVNDQAEEDFPFSGRTLFKAPTDSRAITFGRAENLKADYRQSFLAHRAALSDAVTRSGWGFTTHRTDRPLEAALLALYLHLSGDHVDHGQIGIA